MYETMSKRRVALLFLLISVLILFVSCAVKKRMFMSEKYFGNKYYYSKTDYLNYKVEGKGDVSLVFLHGFAASHLNWQDIIHLLPENKFKSYLIDLKGAGFSSKPKDGKYSIEDNAKIVQDFIKDLNIENFFIIGHSYGGGVALLLSISLLDCQSITPKGMVLLDPAAYETELPFFVSYLRKPVINKLIFWFTSPEFMSRYTLRKVIHDKNQISPDLVKRYSDPMYQSDYRYALIETAKDMTTLKYGEYIDRYGEIINPVLVIWGENDPSLPVESGYKLDKQLKNSRLVVIPECGHNPHEEVPEKVVRLIIDFVDSQVR